MASKDGMNPKKQRREEAPGKKAPVRV